MFILGIEWMPINIELATFIYFYLCFPSSLDSVESVISTLSFVLDLPILASFFSGAKPRIVWIGPPYKYTEANRINHSSKGFGLLLAYQWEQEWSYPSGIDDIMEGAENLSSNQRWLKLLSLRRRWLFFRATLPLSDRSSILIGA